MAGDANSSSSIQRTWSNLPDDNLADVYLRLSSANDRARFADVCTSWQAVTWRYQAPLVPVLLAWTEHSKRTYDRRTQAHSLESGSAFRVPLPWFAKGKRVVGSYNGGWIAAVSNLQQLIIVNLSSGVQVPLSAKQRFVKCTCKVQARCNTGNGVTKIIFSDYPDSSGCVFAAITGRLKLAVCKVGFPNNGWTAQDCGTENNKLLMDIAFCKGRLYGLAHHGREVHKFKIGEDKDGAHAVVTKVAIICIQSPSVFKYGVPYRVKYIFELRGKLAMALQANSKLAHMCEARFYMVFELDDATPRRHRWTEVKTLGDNALFLSPSYSKAIHVSAEGGRGGVERNHIYYSMQHHKKPPSCLACLVRIDLGSFDVYRWKNHVMHRTGTQSVDRLEKEVVQHREVLSLHRWGHEAVYGGKEQVLRRHQVVQGLGQCVETMITSQGYHYINENGRTNGCMWLFLPRDL